MFDAGAIIGKVILDKKDWDKSVASIKQNINALSDRMKNLGQDFIRTGREVSRLGSRFMMLGGIMTGSIIVLMKQLSKENAIIREQFNKINEAMKELGTSISVYIMPHLTNLTKLIEKLTNWFNELSPGIKKLAIDSIILGGAFLLVGGFILKLSGLFVMLIGAVIKGIAIFGTFIALLATKLVVVLATATKSMIAFAIANWKLTLAVAIVIGLLATLVKFNTKVREMFNTLTEGVANMIKGIGEAMGKIFDDLMDKLDKSAIESTQKFADAMNSAMAQFRVGLEEGFRDATKELTNWSNMAKGIVQQMSNSLKTIFSDFFYNFLTGQIRDAKQLFVDFGNFVLRILSEVIAQIITAKIIAGLGTLFTPKTTASVSWSATPIPVKPYQEGTERVPYTGIYRLHEGERVTPKYDVQKAAEQPILIQNFITSEAIAVAMATREGENTIVNIIDRNSLRGGIVRKVIRRR